MYLLDTCALIWLLSNYSLLSEKSRSAIESAEIAYVCYYQ